MVTPTMLYLLVLGVTCLMATPIHWDSLSEGHGSDATDSYSRDDEDIEDGMTEEDSPSKNDEFTKYLEDYGFLPQTLPGQSGPDTAEANLTGAILKFQEFFKLPVTGIADDRVQELSLLPRCGIPDVLSFSLGWFRWYDLNLTYRIVELHDNMPLGRQVIGDVVRDAMQMWMDVTSLILCEVVDQNIDADIHIRHVLGEHGDGISFDGPGGILGHAFLPTHGEIHFDAAENWTVGIADGIDYVQVVVHEIGHALGLTHSGVEGSIMYPFYQFRPKVELQDDDIQGIQLLYGTPNDLPEDVRDQRCPNIETSSSLSGPSQVTEIISTPHPTEGEIPSTTMVSRMETTDLEVPTSSSTPTVSLTSATTLIITNLGTLSTKSTQSPDLLASATIIRASSNDLRTTLANTNSDTKATTISTSAVLTSSPSTSPSSRTNSIISTNPASSSATSTTMKSTTSGLRLSISPTTCTRSDTTSPVITKSLITVITVSEKTSASLESSSPSSSPSSSAPSSPPRSSSSSSLSSSSLPPSSSSSSLPSSLPPAYLQSSSPPFSETTSSTPSPSPPSPSSSSPSSWSPPFNLTPTVAERGETETSSAKESTTFTETGTMVGTTQSVTANTLPQNGNTDFTDVIQTAQSTTTESIPMAPVVSDKHGLGNIGDEYESNSGNSMHNAQIWSLLVLIFYLV